jgi:hypothetical protein
MINSTASLGLVAGIHTVGPVSVQLVVDAAGTLAEYHHLIAFR